jgi:hypothetical protein
MRYASWVSTVAVTLCCLCIVSAACGFEPARRETLLKWDDGSMDSPTDYWIGYDLDGAAVMYDLPEWATCITAVQGYMRCDCDWDGTRADGDAYVYVWAPDEPATNGPGPMVHWSHHALHDTVWSWVTFPFSPPVGIQDPDFHGEGLVFVGISWDPSTGLAFDATQPWSGSSWLRVQSSIDWRSTDVNAMVRAVVSDEYVNPVTPTSWARVKALFR